MVQPLEIKNQGFTSSDFCTGCVIASIAEPYVGEPCDEAFSFAMALRASGGTVKSRGADPKSAIMGAIRYGVMPKSKSPVTGSESREFLADWKNWEPYMDRVTRPFVSFRPVLRPKSVLTGDTTLMAGLFWQADWDKSPFIDDLGEYNKFSPHEVRILGWKNGYYVLQNSRGTSRGDRGIWYYSDELPFHHVYRLTTEPSILDPLFNNFLS